MIWIYEIVDVNSFVDTGIHILLKWSRQKAWFNALKRKILHGYVCLVFSGENFNIDEKEAVFWKKEISGIPGLAS
ncbi:hypothetical protein SAMN02745945_01160 [Peptoclostridium litorale DSM 5388]|uniref:Uncharacterized protein n=1 Tax=Peptoclostridium litorale DSM 5388 TaxID=1121324 RepID=A0A069RGT7_PEPLI|nr:hypothetical protein [Peptoclostridium litorale]KDR93963.1 hypothetical protein CLIT_23c02350 [Peptoclostridium litorale DSM 5388]KDR95390.1 hypothetical protein CLIT_10c01170 [Peptoclostridium litorale DSM 5388]SIN89421.1 hypothetical protein SAMN02745945_01160 [Peptoclostridium litorale DSM 5388]